MKNPCFLLSAKGISPKGTYFDKIPLLLSSCNITMIDSTSCIMLVAQSPEISVSAAVVILAPKAKVEVSSTAKLARPTLA